MMAEDAGSIYSEVRIKIDQLQKDIATAVSVMDRFGQKVVDTANVASNLFSNSYSKSLKQVESYVKSLDKAVTDGAITQRQAIASALEARKAEMAYIQATAAKKGGFTDQEIGDLKRVKGEISSLTEQQKKLGSEVEKSSGNFKLLALAASTAVIAMFRSLVTSSAAYSEALSGVQAATRGSAAELDALAVAAEGAGKQVAASSAQSLGAIEALAKAGVSTADIMGGALTGALTLAAAGEMQVSDAAEIAAATMTQFGLAGADVVHIADLLAAGAGKAQGEVSDLSQALKQAGLVASQTGLSVDDTVGSLAAFASAGLLGSDAGTSFRTMLLRLTPQSKEAAEAMKDLGIDAFDDVTGNFIGITEFAGQLKEQLKDLTVEQRNSALATIFGSDSIRAANVLYNQGAEGIAKWIGKVNDTGFAAEVARIKLDNLAGDLKKLDAQVATSAAKIGGSLDPTLRGLAKNAASFLDFVDDIPEPLAAFGLGAGGVAAGLIGLNAGLALLGINVGILTGGIGFLVIGLSALTLGAIAAGNAFNEMELEKARVDFEALGRASGVAVSEIDEFAVKAKIAKDQLKEITSFKKDFGAKDFEEAATLAGLTNAQLAEIVLSLKNIPPNVKAIANGFTDATIQAKLLAESAKKVDGAWGDFLAAVRGTPTKEVIAGINQTTDAEKALSEEIAYQNYLKKQGAKSEEQALKDKIALRDKEIQQIEEEGAKTGSLTAAQINRIKELQGYNKDNQADLDALKKKTDDAKKATDEKDKAQAESDAARKKGLEDIARLMTTEIQKIEQERDELVKLTNIPEEQAAIKKKAQDKIDAINAASFAKRQASIDAIKKAEEEQIDANIKIADSILKTFSGLANALGDIFAGIYQRQIDEAERAYDIEREKIENNGLTKKQALEKELEDAIAAGDQENIADAQRALDLFNLESDFTKKKAKLEYDAAMASWGIQLAMTTAMAAQAVINAFSSSASGGIVGLIGAPAAAVIAGGVGALQIAAVAAAQPQPPAFATGGIVLPSGSSGKQVTVADKGGGEIMFGTGALGEPLMQGFADLVASKLGNRGGAGGATIQIILDGRMIAESTVNFVDNGIVKMRSLTR